ncbi:hypothetical protein GCM10022222_80140 [Amycolatopsis ultiminotia]|uniref:Lipoprotein n=1 Tax=Amycolatopsis ultiminotia TaxID=543629 RepID=A0ABP6YI53_9PSEU
MKHRFAGALLLLALAGCSAEPPDSPPVTLPAPSSSFHSMFTTAPATPDESAEPTTAAAPVTTAADGHNISACLDGSCEILVATGTRVPFTAENQRVAVVVDSVGPDGIVLSLSGGTFEGEISGGTGDFGSYDDVRFFLASDREGSGVLRLTRG